ncbi:MAG: A/G-specific adenine glycosylase [Phycisphaeraceae bacterium]
MTANTDRQHLVTALLAWHREHRRDLPWRAPWCSRPDPYRVLVSEVMLQQTQVATVIPYFQRFIEAFPSIEALAAADPDRVMKLWQGLGYYSRARRLQACAQAIAAQHGGRVPSTFEALRALPGLGDYTAGAIASIAFGLPVPAIDGNVSRVLSRIDDIDLPVDRPEGKRAVREAATGMLAVLSKSDVGGAWGVDVGGGMVNESLMELGATICTPREPKCLHCPVSDHCLGLARGTVAQRPITTPKRDPRAVEHHVVAMERKGKFLFRQRPSAGLWAEMWELPTLERESVKAATLVDWAASSFGLVLSQPKKSQAFEHRTTHRLITFTLWRAEVSSGRLKAGSGLWRKPSDVDDLPLANPQVRVVGLIDDS